MQAPDLFSVGGSAWAGTAVVYGPPASMGSKRAFVSKKTGKAFVADASSKKLRTFQEGVRDQMRECKPDAPLLGPVSITVIMVMRRPKSHYGTGRNAEVLKADAPKWCTTKPDVDKVLRAICDCGTGIWWRDDAQVCAGGFLKEYAKPGEEERVVIRARQIHGGSDD